MRKLKLIPDSEGYLVEHPDIVIHTQLSGGAGRYRRDKLGATYPVTVQWTLDPVEYNALVGFYQNVTKQGVLPFLIDLVIENSNLEEYAARFVPLSFRLLEQKGLMYKVGATLAVTPNYKRLDAAEDTASVLYDDYGWDYLTKFPPDEDLLDYLVNIKLPETLRVKRPDASEGAAGVLYDEYGRDYLTKFPPDEDLFDYSVNTKLKETLRG